MKRSIALAIVTVVTALPGMAQAQRGRMSSGPAMTPYGPMTNPTQSAEWRQAGGNPMIYEQIMEEKMMVAQQKAMQQEYQAMQKQQQAYQKWFKEQQAKKAKGQPVDPAYQRMLDQEAEYKAAIEARAIKAAAKKAARKTKAVKKPATSKKASSDSKATDSKVTEEPTTDESK